MSSSFYHRHVDEKRFSSIKASFEALDYDTKDGKITPLEFDNYMIEELGVLVPLDIIIKLFKEADTNHDGDLDLEEFLIFILDTQHELTEPPTQIVLRRLFLQDIIGFWPIALYVPAGILFMISSYISYHPNISEMAWITTYIIAHVLYIVQPILLVFQVPIQIWMDQKEDDKMVQTLKKKLLKNAIQHRPDLRSEEKFNNILVARYIQEEIFNSQGLEYLTKLHVEHLLLKELGIATNEGVTDTIFNQMDIGRNGKIYPDDLLVFAMKGENNQTTTSIMKRLSHVVDKLLRDIAYWLNLVFVVALTLGILQFAAMLTSDDPFFNNLKLISWLWLIGTSGFLYQNYVGKTNDYKQIIVSKRILEKFLLAAPLVTSSSSTTTTMAWMEFERNGLDKKGLHLLLEESGIYLSDKVFGLFFRMIDRNKEGVGKSDGLISKSELKDFVHSNLGRRSTICWMCLTSLTFLADFSWLIASSFLIVSAYSSNPKQIQVTDNIGATFFFLGAFPLVYDYFEDALSTYYYEQTIIKELQRRCDLGTNEFKPRLAQKVLAMNVSQTSTPSNNQRGGDYKNEPRLQNIQGGSNFSSPIADEVRNVRVVLKTAGGQPIHARVELFQGGQSRNTINIVSEDGLAHPFSTLMETPGMENILQISNDSSGESFVATIDHFVTQDDTAEGTARCVSKKNYMQEVPIGLKVIDAADDGDGEYSESC